MDSLGVEATQDSLRKRSLVLSSGFLVAGLGAYVMMAVAKRTMDPSEFSEFAVFWSLGFFLTSCVGYALESELSRVAAVRDAAGTGVKGLAGGAVRIAAVLSAVAIVCVLAFATLAGDRFDDESLAVAAMCLLIVGETGTSIVRGILAGLRHAPAVAALVVIESLARTALVAAVAVSGAAVSWAFFAVAGSSYVWVIFVRLVRARSAAMSSLPSSEAARVSRSGVARLALAAPLSAVFAVGTPALASLVATERDAVAVGDVLAALSLTSAPVLLAGALQAALLPSLVRSLSTGSTTWVQSTIRRIVVVVTLIAVGASTVMLLFGPFILRLLFGPTQSIGRWELCAMTLAGGLLFLANMLAPVCIARRSHGAVTTAWGGGALVLVSLMFVPIALADRVSVAMLVGAAVVVVLILVALRDVWSARSLQPTTGLSAEARA